jgi:hypothetical protein
MRSNLPKAVPRLQHLSHTNLGAPRAQIGRKESRQQRKEQDDQGAVPQAEPIHRGQHAESDAVDCQSSHPF